MPRHKSRSKSKKGRRMRKAWNTLRAQSPSIAFCGLVLVAFIISLCRGSGRGAFGVILVSVVSVWANNRIERKPSKSKQRGVMHVNLVGCEWGVNRVAIKKHNPVDLILSKISSKMSKKNGGEFVARIGVVFAGEVLDPTRTVESYGISNGSNLIVLFHEDDVCMEMEEEKQTDSQPDVPPAGQAGMPDVSNTSVEDGDAGMATETTTVEDSSAGVAVDPVKAVAVLQREQTELKAALAADMITLESNGVRYDMLCGPSDEEVHALSPTSLLDYIQHTITDGKHQIVCPKCQAEWDYPYLRRVLHGFAEFTPAIRAEIEQKLSANLISQKMNARRAACCSVVLRRSIFNMNFDAGCVGCNGGKFCWACLTPWSEGAVACSNAKCPSWVREVTCKVLERCPTKHIDHMEAVPVLRACPTCGQLITHISDCKHIDCPICHISFCFICAVPADEFGNYQCGYERDSCPLADRQTKAQLVPTGLRSYSNVLNAIDDRQKDDSVVDQDAKQIASSAQFYEDFAQQLLQNLQAAGWDDNDY